MTIRRFFKIIAALFFTACFELCAASFESFAKYEVKYGFIKIGEATAFLKIYDNNSYKTEIKAKARGIAATLSNNREETYKSVGRVVDSKLIPESFEKYRVAGKKTKSAQYVFDHELQQAAVFEERCNEDGCSYSSEMAPEYAPNDILSLYHNVGYLFAKEGIKELNTSAIGSKKLVYALLPKDKQLEMAQKSFENKNGLYVLAILNQDIFSSDNGELYINLDEDMIVSEAVLKNTTIFGDIWGKLLEKNIKGTRQQFDAVEALYSK